MLFNKKKLAFGILHGFAAHVIFVFLQSVISEDGRLHRFVRGVCSVQSSSLRCVRYLWQCKQNIFQAKYRTEARAVVWNKDLWFFFFFFSFAQMAGWASAEFDTWIRTRESSASPWVLVPCFSPSMFGLLWSPVSACVSRSLPAGTGCTRAIELTRPSPEHGFLVVMRNCWPCFKGSNGGCYSLCSSSARESSGAHSWEAQGRERFPSGAEGLWEPTTFSQQPPTGLPTPAFTPPCSIPTGCSLLVFQTRRWSLGNGSIWNVFIVAFVARRKELTFGETLDPGARAPGLWTPT